MKLADIIRQPEGRRLEFKQELPSASDLCKTIVAFANDAGGEIYIGVRNEPREIVGVPDDELFALEERISNIIHAQCSPIIMPDITFYGDERGRCIKITGFSDNFCGVSKKRVSIVL